MNYSSVPPVAPRRPHVHTEHGVDRPDPYFWMRDKADPEILPYLRNERAFYDNEVASLRELHDGLATEMVGRVAESDESARWREGRHYYFTRTVSGAEFEQFCRLDDAGSETVLLDENTLLEDSSYVEVGIRYVSPDERFLAYSVDLDGDEVYELRFRDLATLQDLDERVEHSYYGGAWSADAKTFFYVVHDHIYRPYQVWRHELGTDASTDVLVFEESDQQFDLDLWADRAGDYIVIFSASRDTSETHLIDAHHPAQPPRCLAPRRRTIEYLVAHLPGSGGGSLLIVTNDGASEFRLMQAPVGTSSADDWREVVAEQPDERLHNVEVFRGHVVLQTVRRGRQQLRLLSWEALDTPDPLGASIIVDAGIRGGLITLSHNEEFDADHVMVGVESFVQPLQWQAIDLSTGERTLLRERNIPAYEPANYVIEERWVTARDGEEVPVRLVRHKATALDGSAPLLLWGYGAYESAFWPGFEIGLASLLDRGMVFAHAGIRGGGDMGRRWWLDGRLERKINTFTDFIDVADALAADGTIDGERIVSRGMSAGGLLQGVVYGMRPDRWRAVIAEVPFVDAINSMLDGNMPLTANERDEWGDPRVKEHFDAMMQYSPYENVPTDGRPDLLVTGALHDPRVMVHEPAKWVARLRETDSGSGGRVLFRAEIGEGGHSGPTGRYAAQAYEAEICAFVLDVVGLAKASAVN